MRGTGQFIPMARRVVYAASLLAEPTLQEPVFLGKQDRSGLHREPISFAATQSRSSAQTPP
jgi:hypothetical protein